MISFAAGVGKGSGPGCWINSPTASAASTAGYLSRRPAVSIVRRSRPTQGKTTGYDAGKKIQGRKRHLLVDTLGLLREVVVTAADVDDRDGLKQVLTRYSSPDVPRLRKLWVDGGYQGEAIRTWVAELKKTHKIDLEVVAKQGPGFTLLKRRWVVERTLAWLMNFRRHARDYEVLTRHSEALIQIAMIHLLLKRIK